MRTKNQTLFLKGKRLYLRPIEEGDLNRCRRWINDPDIRRFVHGQFPLDSIAEKQWFEGASRGKPMRDIHFAIVLIRGDRHIGNIGLHGIDWVNRNATTGALIGEADCRDKGYGSAAKELLLAYAFDTLGLHRINSFALATNGRSLAYLKKSGYVIEGRHREAYFRDGRWIDHISLGILADDWRARRRR